MQLPVRHGSVQFAADRRTSTLIWIRCRESRVKGDTASHRFYGTQLPRQLSHRDRGCKHRCANSRQVSPGIHRHAVDFSIKRSYFERILREFHKAPVLPRQRIALGSAHFPDKDDTAKTSSMLQSPGTHSVLPPAPFPDTRTRARRRE